MVHKFPLQLFLIFMVFSCVILSSASLQTTRRLLSKGGKSSMETTLVQLQGGVEFRNIGEDVFVSGEELMVKERMNLEIEDYPGTGANNRHDPPKAPGRT